MCFQNPHRVVEAELAQISLRPPATGQLLEQHWILSRVAEAGRQLIDTADVAAEADVVDSDPLTYVIAVVGDIGNTHLGGGAVLSGVHPFTTCVRDEGGHEGHHRHSPVAGHPVEDVVGDVARMRVESEGAGVAEDHRQSGDVQGLVHDARRDV